MGFVVICTAVAAGYGWHRRRWDSAFYAWLGTLFALTVVVSVLSMFGDIDVSL